MNSLRILRSASTVLLLLTPAVVVLSACSRSDSCKTLTRQYERKVSEASTNCNKDLDCECYSAIGKPGHGGAARSSAAGEIDTIANRYVKKCPTAAVYWEPTKCEGRCRDGRCRTYETPF